MGNHIKVSVIVPVYNSEQYVRAAVESILAQDCDGFEVLLVDDGSTDASGCICDELASLDGRVRVFHRANGGMCAARNFAIARARGDYLAFADNDDVVLPGFLSANYALAEANDADVVYFGRRRDVLDEEGRVIHTSVSAAKEQGVFRGDEIFRRFDLVRYGSDAVWRGLYRRSLLVDYGICFDERLTHGSEDRLFNLSVYDVARCIVLNPDVYYVWLRRPSHSMSFKIDENYLLGRKLDLDAEHELLDSHAVKRMIPELYGRLMTRNLVSTLQDSAYGVLGGASLRELDEGLDLLRDMYEPYFDELRHVPLERSRRLLLDALRDRRWWVLRAYVWGGRVVIRRREAKARRRSR